MSAEDRENFEEVENGEVKDGENNLDDTVDLWMSGDDPEGDDPEGDDPGGDDPEGDDPEGDDPEETKKDVPVSTHIKMKQKLKKRASDKEEENQRLREENEELKRRIDAVVPVTKEKLVRPNPDDFEETADYDAAVKEYEEKLVDARIKANKDKENLEAKQREYFAKRDAAVDEHYDRAAKLVEESKIDPDVYKSSEDKVRDAIAAAMPKKEMGDIMVDHLISIMGDGSEKVLYYIGRNKKILDELIDVVKNDSSGISASMFVGRQLEKVANTKNRVSRARKPLKEVNGDSPNNNKETAWLNKYKKAHKEGNEQAAFDIRRKARKNGINTREW